MGWTSVSPAAGGGPYLRIIPNDGDCYTDAGGTTPATADNDTLLSVKCQTTGKVLPKVTTGSSTQNAKLRISNGVKRVQHTNSAIGTNTNGSMFRYNSDTTYNPAGRTIFMIVSLNRMGKVLADLIMDIGNSLTGSVNQIGVNTAAAHLSTYNNTSFSNNTTPFMTVGNYPTIICIQPRSGAVLRFYRQDLYDTSGNQPEVVTARTITSSATGTGISIGGRNAENLFMSGDWWGLEDWPVEFTEAEIRQQMNNMAAWCRQIGIPIYPWGSKAALCVVGDSNVGIRATQRSTGLGGVIHAGMVGTYTDLEWFELAAASRTFTSTDDYVTQPIIDFFKRTLGPCVLAVNCGENDETTQSAATVYQRVTDYCTPIKAACPWCRIVYIEPWHRGDSDTSAVVTALDALIDADATFGGVVDACYRTTGDSVFGDRATFTGPNATYVDGDKIHLKDAAYTRMWSTTDAPETLQTICTAQFLASAKASAGRKNIARRPVMRGIKAL